MALPFRSSEDRSEGTARSQSSTQRPECAEIEITEATDGLSKEALLRSPRCCPLHTTLTTTIGITFCRRLLTDAKEGIVVQLKLLDLMIRNQDEAVPMGAKARADLTNHVARLRRFPC